MSTNPGLTPSQVAPSAQALLALGDEAFVRSAYLTLLGREVDPSGLESYLTQVRTGVDKAAIVAQLALSDEGRQKPQALPGLAALVDAQNPRARPWYRRLARRLLHPWRNPHAEPMARTLRAIDNRLDRIETLLQMQAADLTGARGQIAQLAISVETGRGNGVIAAGTAGGGNPPSQPLPRQAPVRVEQIYRGLQRMLARRTSIPD